LRLFCSTSKKERKKILRLFCNTSKKERNLEIVLQHRTWILEIVLQHRAWILEIVCSIRMNSWDCLQHKKWILEIVQLDRHSWGAKLWICGHSKSRSWIHIYWVILVSLSEQAKFGHSSLLQP
jgi:hypothetical protein